MERYDALGFDYGEILNCIRCGFCLPTCPTYIETGQENASPRGRIALMKAAADGVLPLDDIEEQIDLCLGCLNCVTACPAGVQFGHLLEDARKALVPTRRETFLDKVLYDWVLPRPGIMRSLGTLLWLYQASGLRWLVQKSGLTKLLPAHMRDMERILPRVRPPWQRHHKPMIKPSETVGGSAVEASAVDVSAVDDPTVGGSAVDGSSVRSSSSSPHVAFFTGCIMDLLFWDVNRDSIALLADAGCTVTVIEGQSCCGALHAHSGRKESAKELARKNIAAFEVGRFDFIVNSIGGCGAALKEYGHWLKDDPEWGGRATAFVEKVRDFSEMLVELDYEPVLQRQVAEHPSAVGTGPVVTMQQSCHLAHGQSVRSQPMHLLRQSGAEICEMIGSDRCCGSAGIYNLIQPDMAGRVLDTKMEHVRATGAQVIVTTNPGCQLQMNLGVRRAGMSDEVEVVHLAQFLARRLSERPVQNEVKRCGSV